MVFSNKPALINLLDDLFFPATPLSKVITGCGSMNLKKRYGACSQSEHIFSRLVIEYS